jgi:dihydrodipicolinate synthase/N-acetylneuraminate lyase
MVKANDGTVGYTADGCRQLAEIVNVFVGEDQWAELVPLGAAGGCASLTYWFPRYVMELWRQVEAGNWSEASRRCSVLGEVFEQLGAAFKGRGFMDSAYDRLGGALCGFLKGGLNCRGPYPSATPADVAVLRRWCEQHHPELLQT